MRRTILECELCGARLDSDTFTIEINDGSLGPFKFSFRGEAVYFSPCVEGDADHFCGWSCMHTFFERKAKANFKKWVNGRNDLKPDEIIVD